MDRFFKRKLTRRLPGLFRQRVPEPYGLETEGVEEKTSSVKRGGKNGLISSRDKKKQLVPFNALG